MDSVRFNVRTQSPGVRIRVGAFNGEKLMKLYLVLLLSVFAVSTAMAQDPVDTDGDK